MLASLAATSNGAALGAAAAASLPQSPSGFRGWREALLIVPDVRPWIETFTTVGGWEVLAYIEHDRSLNAFWALPADAQVRQVLMHNRDERSGFIRLITVAGAAQQRIRPHDQAWETGGIAALDLRVLDMDATRTALEARGWRAPSDPVRYEAYPGVDVIQWAPVSPDGVRLSFIQRISPPLVGWPALKRWSRAINAAAVVRDMNLAVSFYSQTLGMQIGGRSKALGSAGPNVMGLPWSFQKIAATEILGFRSPGDDGSVELICIPEAQGRDYSAAAHPPNLGIAALRWMIEDTQPLRRSLEENSAIQRKMQPIMIEPYGQCLGCAVRTIDGVWLEFVQPAS